METNKIWQNKTYSDDYSKRRVVSIIWKHQETQVNGPIDENLLFKKTGLSRKEFFRLLSQLLLDPKSGVYATDERKIWYKFDNLL